MKYTSLKGKHILITGGSRGIGRATVLAFAEAGSSVSFIYNKSEKDANELMALAKTKGYSVKGFRYNLLEASNFHQLVKNLLANYGPINILVNNAGIKIRTDFLASTLEDWDQTIATNLRSVYFLSQVVSKEMTLYGGGKIINIASQSGICHVSTSLEYGISKSGIVYLTRSLAKILAPSKITVNAVSPGRTYTDLTGYSGNKIKEDAAINNIPLKKINTPQEIAEVVLFFASDDANNITGQVLAIDGGEGIC